MSRQGMLFPTAALMLFAACALCMTAWLRCRPSAGTSPRYSKSNNSGMTARQALLRYQQGQPRHWRQLMMQP